MLLDYVFKMAPIEAHLESGDLNKLMIAKHGPTKINMALLMDFMLQKTYHDLSVMAELLPRKSDIERKIAIIEFATKSRQQFVRLLALVKWASSAERVDKCQVISSFLDQQSFLFVDTADKLARTARETLVNARLPAFCLPAAVDVLTTESYSRLPSCIKDRIVPADPVRGTEKIKTLQRLDQVIQQRLVTSKIPPKMSDLVIADGRVKFTVEDEFEASLTLMGDEPTVPWRLLSVEFLVQDFKTGEGKSLVHGLQVQYIHQLAQSRLFVEEYPLVDLFNCLHSFCSLLQLEVLHSQAQRLVRERWLDNVKIENYIVGQKLTLSYWRNVKHENKNEKQTYSLSVVVTGDEQLSSLKIVHNPALEQTGNHVTISTKRLCIETILSETVRAQSLRKLEIVKGLLEKDENVKPLVYLDNKIPELVVQTQVTTCVCNIFVETRTGVYNVIVTNCEDIKYRANCRKVLNNDIGNFLNVFNDLRCALRIRQCEKAVQHLCTTSLSLPIVNHDDGIMAKLSKHKLFMNFENNSKFYLIVAVNLEVDAKQFSEKYYLLKVKPSSSSTQNTELSSGAVIKAEKKAEGFFLRANEIIQLDPDVITMMASQSDHVSDRVTRTDVFCSSDKEEVESKKARTVHKESTTISPLPKIKEVYNSCNIRIPFMGLCSQLHKTNVPYLDTHRDIVNCCVRILDIPAPPRCDKKDVNQVKRAVLDCVISHDITRNEWMFDLIMENPPFQTDQAKLTQHVLLKYQDKQGRKSSWSQFLEDWESICCLYKHAKELDDYLQDSRCQLSDICSIHSFTYKELIIAYGPGLLNLVAIKWSEKERTFVFAFSHLGDIGSGHEHEIIAGILKEEFAKHYNLPYVMQILQDTFSPFQSLATLTTTPTLGRGNNVLPAFTIIPQSSTRAKVSYKNFSELEFHFRAKQLVSIRDSIYTQVHFERNKASHCQPINNLKAFLQLYKDDLSDAAAKNPYCLNWQSSINSSREATFVNRQKFHPPTHHSSPQFPMVYNEMGSLTTQRSSPVSQLRLAPLTPLHLPVPSQAIPMSPTVPNYLTPSTATTHFNPVPSPYSNTIPSPATPYQLSATSPATPQAAVASPAVPVTSPGTSSWVPSPQLPTTTGLHQRISAPRIPVTTQQSTQQPMQAPRKISWSIVRPVLLSHESLRKLTTPIPVVVSAGYELLISPFEQFLGCHYLLKQLPRYIIAELKSQTQFIGEKFDITGLVFKTRYLKFTIALDTNTFTALRLKIIPLPGQENMWSRDELQDLEHFFETKVVCYPYKMNNVASFLRLISAEQAVLKDCIKIIRLETNKDPSHRWNVEWCLTIPPADQIRKNLAGSAAVVIKNKVVFFIQLTKSGQDLSDGVQDNAIIVPILYYPENGNVTTLDVVGDSSSTLSPHTIAVIEHLKNWNKTTPRAPGSCPIYQAVVSLLRNLVVPDL